MAHWIHSRGNIGQQSMQSIASTFQNVTFFGCIQVASLELRTNVLAAYVSGGRAHEVPAVMEAMKISPKDSFEIGFNTACGLLAAGDCVSAQDKLEHAQRLGDSPYMSFFFCEAICCVHALPHVRSGHLSQYALACTYSDEKSHRAHPA